MQHLSLRMQLDTPAACPQCSALANRRISISRVCDQDCLLLSSRQMQMLLCVPLIVVHALRLVHSSFPYWLLVLCGHCCWTPRLRNMLLAHVSHAGSCTELGLSDNVNMHSLYRLIAKDQSTFQHNKHMTRALSSFKKNIFRIRLMHTLVNFFRLYFTTCLHIFC